MTDIQEPLKGRMSRRERMLMTVVMSLVLLFVFACGELALRFLSKVSDYAPKVYMPFYEKHSYLGKTLTPNYHYSTSLASFSVNSRGFRGAEFEVPKPENVYRIFALGGSTTFGFFPAVTRDESTYPAQLEKRLNKSVPFGQRIEVINAGVPGYSTRTSLANFANRILYYQPDMILVYHNTNDLSRYGHEDELLYPLDKMADRRGQLEIVGESLFGWSYLLTELNYTVMNRLVPMLWASTSPAPRAQETPWQEDVRYGEAFRRDLTNLVAVARANQVETVLISQSIAITEKTDFGHLTQDELNMQLGKPDPYHTGIPLSARFYMFNRYNQIIEEVAKHEGVYFVDGSSALPKTSEYHWDYCHFTDKGASLLAERVAETVTPVLLNLNGGAGNE